MTAIDATSTPSASNLAGLTDATPPQAAAFSGMDKDAFLKLLVAQLRYQNPMQPTDGQQYLTQAAAFATVERLDQLAQAQSEVAAYQKVLLTSSLLGREVTGVALGGGEPVSGAVTGVRFEQGVPMLEVGGHDLPVGDLTEMGR